MISCEFFEISKNTSSYRTTPVAPSDQTLKDKARFEPISGHQSLSLTIEKVVQKETSSMKWVNNILHDNDLHDLNVLVVFCYIYIYIYYIYIYIYIYITSGNNDFQLIYFQKLNQFQERQVRIQNPVKHLIRSFLGKYLMVSGIRL